MDLAADVDLDRDLPLCGLTPAPAERGDYRYFAVTPQLGADFAFNMVLPTNWRYVAPTGVIDLDEGPAPLGVFTEDPPVTPTAVSVGALRANPRVSLMEFFAGYVHIAGYMLATMRPLDIPAFHGIDGLIDRPDGARMRLLMSESGGRVLVIAGMSLRALYPDKALGLARILFSCEFTVTGARVMTVTPIAGWSAPPA